MKYNPLKSFSLTGLTFVGTMVLAVVPVSALASVNGAGAANSNAASSTAQTKQLQLIISRGNNEITRRLTTLNKLSSKISSDTKLSASDKSNLTDEVNTEIGDLTSLKTTLDGETLVANAKTDAQSIFTEYRVYALVMPKIYLVKTADAQQITETKLTTLAGKIQNDITADQKAGKDVSSLQTTLNDMTAKVQAAQSISSNIESSVVNLQPSDYNSDHTVLSGDNAQLKTAQSDITATVTDAKSLVSSLASL
jgi:hypothetical protein